LKTVGLYLFRGKGTFMPKPGNQIGGQFGPKRRGHFCRNTQNGYYSMADDGII